MANVVVYSTNYCPYCTSAKALLHRKGIAFKEIDVTDQDEAREELTRRTGLRTVPQIFIGDRHVGGFTDLAALNRSGELDALLAGN